MSKEPELKARDKVILRMTRDGAVEKNLTAVSYTHLGLGGGSLKPTDESQQGAGCLPHT